MMKFDVLCQKRQAVLYPLPLLVDRCLQLRQVSRQAPLCCHGGNLGLQQESELEKILAEMWVRLQQVSEGQRHRCTVNHPHNGSITLAPLKIAGQLEPHYGVA